MSDKTALQMATFVRPVSVMKVQFKMWLQDMAMFFKPSTLTSMKRIETYTVIYGHLGGYLPLKVRYLGIKREGSETWDWISPYPKTKEQLAEIQEVWQMHKTLLEEAFNGG